MGTARTPDSTPFLDLLLRYVRSAIAPYHTPGHKQGRAAPPRLLDALGSRPFLLDLDGELGEPGEEPWDGVAAEGDGPAQARVGRQAGAVRDALQEAEALAAEAHGAQRARFLVNGTTGGLHALLLAATGPGCSVILPRNVHRSVLGGLILSGARPWFMRPGFLAEAGLATVPTEAALAEALARAPHPAAVLLTAPTYYGWLPAVRPMAEMAAARGVPLWVDEAHGALLGFHPGLPPGALTSGAAAAVRSMHKGGGSLVQSSLLLVGSGGPDPGRLDAALSLLQSTSPSPLLLASLDAARAWLQGGALSRLERLLQAAEWLRAGLNRIPGIRCWGPEVLGREGIAAWDPTRIVFSVAGLGLTGLRAAAWLRRECRLQVEMADLANVVVVLSPADGKPSVERLLNAVQRLAASRPRPSGGAPPAPAPPPLPPALLTPREAFLAPARRVPWREAEGEAAAEMVAPYPPGVPVLVPGEQVTRESLEYLEQLRRAGARIEGASDPTGATLLVVAGSPAGGRTGPGRELRQGGGGVS